MFLKQANRHKPSDNENSSQVSQNFRFIIT